MSLLRGKGFLEVKSIEKGDPEVMPTPHKTVQTNRSNFETPEERAKKQVYIVKQSSISNALVVLSVGAKAPPSAQSILDLAQIFTNCGW